MSKVEATISAPIESLLWRNPGSFQEYVSEVLFGKLGWLQFSFTIRILLLQCFRYFKGYSRWEWTISVYYKNREVWKVFEVFERINKNDWWVLTHFWSNGFPNKKSNNWIRFFTIYDLCLILNVSPLFYKNLQS